MYIAHLARLACTKHTHNMTHTLTHAHTCTHTHAHTHTRTHTNTHMYTCTLHTIAQLITQPPESTTTALSTNATFSCHGNGSVFWEINRTQVLTESQVREFAQGTQEYVPLPTSSFSLLIMTATVDNNFTQIEVICLVDPGLGVGELQESNSVHLLVYGEYSMRIL